MKPAGILSLFPFKPEDMPKIATIAKKPTRVSIKAFQESIQDQYMSITTCDHNLGFLGMVLRASDFDPLNKGNLFVPPINAGPAHVNFTRTSAQSNELVSLYKDDKTNSLPTVNFAIF